ncbi:hypothetical protein M011DRAFT_457035 [Sporormia fimetaria CBS 119925]|uniref:PH domain-containing protein n=1 Tax=Sporormia fimetaria CBS 119925 TaxID=1340428 RepID=A0A6A6VIH3_9PLEO|nr:hypothetical protein M011DRAFT_457035 [Sporormia fimetaria CBS 119925]
MPTTAQLESAPPTPALGVPTGRSRGQSTSRNDKSSVFEKLSALGLRQVLWVGKCEAEKVSLGTYNVPEGEGGMYGLVFDNTFSKTVSKTVTFVLMTYPSSAPPKSGHHMRYAQNMAGASSTSLGSPSLGVADSSESLPRDFSGKGFADRPKSSHNAQSGPPSNSSFMTGVLYKKRRKRNQGYARRFFSLDFTSSTLSYYRNDHSSALRGAIPLSLAAVGANEKNREISVDSGAEIWHLRASNDRDFNMWKEALDQASRTATGVTSPTLQLKIDPAVPFIVNQAEESEWTRVEALTGRVAGIRDAVRRLAMDTDPKYSAPSSGASGLGISKAQDTLSPSPLELDHNDYFQDTEKGQEKKAFWKRKASSSGGQSPAAAMRRSVSAQVAIGSPSIVPPVPPLPSNGNLHVPKRSSRLSSHHAQEEGIHDHCMSILRDLDTVVQDFSTLLSESRHRRTPMPSSAATGRRSTDSRESMDEFFDAQDGETSKSQLLTIRRDSQGSDRSHTSDREEVVSDAASSSSSSAGDRHTFDRERFSIDGRPSLYPSKPKSLTPLPLSPVPRRKNVPDCRSQPPNLLSFFRKNVGKDFSTISMPVTTNEPTSALQRLAEQFEYSELLDAAASSPDPVQRILLLSAFSISSFSNMRLKDRAIRKPFNPMLGETYELIREDKNFRFVAEKVVHRPVTMACHCESASWTFTQSPIPVQKFWGKSAELNTDGRVRIWLHDVNEWYSYSLATSFLRNVIAGEKYVEPTGTMTIVNESSGMTGVCTFKAGGMFAGRSEDVSVSLFDSHGSQLPAGLAGKWTSELHITQNGKVELGAKPIWRTASLVPQAEKHYGFTQFAASLNEITLIENGRLPPTDSRLRPDQRKHEEGDIDSAEGLKARLEERQRARRRVMEEHGEVWRPRWFVKVEEEGLDEEIWRLRGGKEGYWECREEGRWEGVVEVFA